PTASSTPRPAPAAAPAAARAASAAAAAPSASSATTQVTVRPGDTAGRIAAAHMPANVSLEQMLAAMLRTNPSAFVDGNVNLLKAGAVLDLPDAEQAKTLTQTQARQTLTAQSRDFNSFRRKLATSATPATLAAAERSATGKLAAEVADRKPATNSPDKLMLSKGAVDARSGASSANSGADTFAKTSEARDAAQRAAELQKNVNDLNKLQAATAGATAVPSGPGDSLSTAAATSASSAATGASATGGSDAGTTAATTETLATTPAIAAAGAKPAPKAAAAEAGIVDQMLEEPLLPALGLGLVALLAGFGFYRSRQRKADERTFLSEGDGAPESFFGVSGGQEVDAQHGQTSHGSSVLYSASQLDAGGEVDPVAEADVYLAYGRDQQAIDALKEAIRTTPERVIARTKLLEIHARRNEASEFEALAAETQHVVGANSPEWQRISELGRDFDFANPLYQPTSGDAAPTAVRSSAVGASTMPSVLGADLDTGASASVTAAAALAAASLRSASNAGWNLPFDLDLDLGAHQLGHAAGPVGLASGQPGDTSRAPLDLDLSDFGGLEPTPKSQPRTFTPKSNAPKDRTNQFSADSGNWVSPPTRPAPLSPKDPAPVSAAAAAGPLSGMIDFDFSSLRLDLDPPAPAGHAASEPTGTTTVHAHSSFAEATAVASVEDDDALSTKLALAEAFSAIGDVDGARSLAQEVAHGSSGQLKDRAQRFLSSIR
ncbi:MAG: FimV/HubP family polar landmark protein, partial [Burkholderiales bacterium]